MTKAEEIAILNDLRNSDSYFAESYTTEDIDVMINNINMDFPLLASTQAVKKLDEQSHLISELTFKVDKLQTELDEVKKSNTKLTELRAKTLKTMVLGGSIIPTLEFTSDEILRAKVKFGVELTSSEKEKILELL
jgi:hypothetical protein